MIDVDRETAAVLERFGFDEPLFESLRAQVAAGELSPASNVVQGSIEPPRDDDITKLPATGDARYESARAAGLEALERGEVAQVVLAGGMATRFGGVVKAVLTAVDGKSFLEAKLVQTARLEQALACVVPVALMTSFATDEAIRAHVVERDLGEPLVFNQFVSLRLETSGELFREESGKASLYAPGHGDLFQALRRSGTLAALRERGVRIVMVSNVDNLGARVDPVVVGMHLLGQRPLTCEVARKEGDMGGAPVRVDGKLQLVEGPRFPPSFEQDARRSSTRTRRSSTWMRSTSTTTSPGCTCARRSPGETPSSSSASITRSRRSSPRSTSRCRVAARAVASRRSRRPPTSSARRTTCASSSQRRRSDVTPSGLGANSARRR